MTRGGNRAGCNRGYKVTNNTAGPRLQNYNRGYKFLNFCAKSGCFWPKTDGVINFLVVRGNTKSVLFSNMLRKIMSLSQNEQFFLNMGDFPHFEKNT